MSTSVLYDAPGPRTKRRILIGSVIAGLLLLGVLALLALRLDKQHQFDIEKWAPLFDPSNEQFPLVWQRIGEALGNTLVAAGLAVVFSLVVGTLLAVTRVTAARWYRWAVVGVVELLRGVPVVIAIFFASRVLPQFGLDLEPLWFLVIGLTAYNSVVIAEIIRAGINSLPKGQGEAAESLGLRRGQVLSLVLLPQAFRAMLPALISQLVVVLKDTSLGFVISYEELVRVAGQIVQVLSNPIQVYLLIAVIFILINYALSRFAIFTERRLSQGKKAATATLSATDVAGAGTGGGG
ncbi:amino acid ABC transporter permease [Actinokineospora sp. NBRC 105648]|uniref:amino acid ABC transporter permease n=1 Tax=Actinokineospora sp. NBRC 105648 TaxID=3032206 RepID=UPI0024A0C3C3|nr:amino acid ABC transporter permease [Actinokineospora sp. NBRC 105648]GLZ38643.1 glutamate ABC transporter permease [Actinokineospora sp. NBRC 105648]